MEFLYLRPYYDAPNVSQNRQDYLLTLVLLQTTLMVKMPPNSDDLGSIGFKTRIPGFGGKEKSARAWLNGRRQVDGAEGYWRVHDGLYNLENFITKHPGGPQWLQLTQGTDITEAFEAHHLDDAPENMLKRFYVKSAETPRISPYTFEENGFYRTLKRRISTALKDMPRSALTTSALYTDGFFFLTLLFSVLTCKWWSYLLGCCAGICLGSLLIAAHNYFHQRDNFRMYYFQLGLLSVKEWRVSHALSHHLFPNSIIDMEMYILEPFVSYFPKDKSFLRKYLPWVYMPPLWGFLFHSSFFIRMKDLLNGNSKVFTKTEFIPLILPTFMYIFGGQALIPTLAMWNFILMAGSYYFLLVGLNAAHHAPEIFHDGDTPRKEKDFGISQLDTVIDRGEILNSHLWTLTTFGHHALHHLFPTLDHGLLHKLLPILKKTMEEFDVDLRLSNSVALFKGQFKQIANSEPNPNPPDLHSWKNK